MATWRQRLAGRLRRSGTVEGARRLARRTAAWLSPSVRAEARETTLPLRHRWLRIGSVGPVPAPFAGYVVRDLLRRPLAPTDRPLDLVLVPGASTGGPSRLAGPVIDVLIDCERRSVPTVLLASDPADLRTDVAAVCRDIACTDTATAAAARPLAGPERSRLVMGGNLPHNELPEALLAIMDG
ncbi:MAG: hypothetical protein ACOC9R_01685 [bacterium]